MRFRAQLILALMAMLVVSGTLAQSPRTTVTSTPRVLLLRNGQTLEGNITRTGDYYLVTRGVTSEVRLPATSVELVCDDLEALYQYKIKTLERGSREGHLALARWCLQHELLARAADQTLMAFVLDPGAPGLDNIERRLLAAERPADDGASGTANARSVPTQHEIEQVIESMPAGTVQQFVSSIQPLLLNRCATNGCHGTVSTAPLKLLRPTTRQSLSRRMTQRNLFATLAYVDRGNPLQSQLLTVLATPHGGRGAVFSETETHQIQLLAKWVAGLANQPLATLPQSVASPPAVLLQTRPEAIEELMKAFSPDETQPTVEPARGGGPENLAEEYEPRDPFDPEIFNRRFRRNANNPR